MRKVTLLIVLTLGATGAQAENGRFYLAGVTSSSLTDDTFSSSSNLNTDLKNNSWKAFAGVRPIKWAAFEANYVDLGSGSNFLFGNSESTTTPALEPILPGESACRRISVWWARARNMRGSTCTVTAPRSRRSQCS